MWAALSAVLLSAACSDDDESGDVDTACDRLEVLAEERWYCPLLPAPRSWRPHSASRSPSSSTLPRTAATSELAEEYQSSFEVVGGDPGASAAADVALDRAGARCRELGATNSFPEEP